MDYDRVHDLWSQAHAVGSPVKFVRDKVVYRELGKLNPGRTLDAGCGTGDYSAYLSQHGHKVTAFDPSPLAIKKLKEKHKSNESLAMHVSSVEAFSSSELFDNVVSIEVIEHIEDDLKAVRKLYQLLREGGSLVISVPASPLLYCEADRVSGHYRRYSSDAFRKLLANCHFQEIDVRRYGFPLLFLYVLARKLFLDKALIDHFDQSSPCKRRSTITLSSFYPYIFSLDHMNLPIWSVGYVAICKK